MTRRYFIEISYKGTRYHGWQIQPNARTVQGDLNKALSTILREDITTMGAGRTDTGVHASQFFVHFDSVNHNYENDKARFIYKINSFLKEDISVKNIWHIPFSAHARYDAVSRSYIYDIHQHKDPFVQEYSWFIPHKLDVNVMNQCASSLFDYTDFTSFAKLHGGTKTNICHINQAFWECKTDKKLRFYITADRFLRNMVRALVGTMVEVGQGKISHNNFRKIVECRNRNSAGFSAPGKGLFLHKIVYSDEIQDILLSE